MLLPKIYVNFCTTFFRTDHYLINLIYNTFFASAVNKWTRDHKMQVSVTEKLVK